MFKHRKTKKLSHEALEERKLLTAVDLVPNILTSNGAKDFLVVNAGPGNDHIEIVKDATSDTILIKNYGSTVGQAAISDINLIVVNGDGGNDTIDASGLQGISLPGISIIMNGNEGNDSIIGRNQPSNTPFTDKDSATGGTGSVDNAANMGVGSLGFLDLDNTSNSNVAQIGSLVYVRGTSSAESIVVDQLGTNLTVEINGSNVLTSPIPLSSVSRIIVAAEGGNDFIDVDVSNVVSQLIGGDGSDYIDGTDGKDILNGGYGNDWVLGRAGDDLLIGSSGTDYLFAGTGADFLYGGWGNDFLDAGNDSDDDEGFGGSGNDVAQNFNPNDVFNQ